MKKLWLLAMVLLSTPSFGQWNPNISYVTYYDVTYNNTDKDTIYVLFPTQGQWYISETRPTQYVRGSEVRKTDFDCTGDVYLNLEDNRTSGAFDSLAHWIKPLVWEPKDKEFSIMDHDSTFLVFDTKGTYTASSVDYLDPITGKAEGCSLSGELWATAGFVIIGRQADEGTAVAVVTYWLSLVRNKY
jgi:hypothetical protein